MEGAGKAFRSDCVDRRVLNQHSGVELAGVPAVPDIPKSERWSLNAERSHCPN